MTNRQDVSQSPSLRHLFYQRNISVRDLLDKLRVWVIQHHMEMLNRMYRLERLPILKPDYLWRLTLALPNHYHKFKRT